MPARPSEGNAAQRDMPLDTRATPRSERVSCVMSPAFRLKAHGSVSDRTAAAQKPTGRAGRTVGVSRGRLSPRGDAQTSCTRTAASRARTRSRIASWAGSGTHTDDSSPARCNLARLIASRRSVLTRSPGLRGINDGATTTHSCPALNLRLAEASPSTSATGRSRGVADTGEGTSASDAGWWAAGHKGSRRAAAKYAFGRQRRRPLPQLTGRSIWAAWVLSAGRKRRTALSTWRPSSG